MAGSQTAITAEQDIARLVADHAASCAKLACSARDESLDVALDLIVFPAAVLLIAVLLHRVGFWDRLARGLSARLKRKWLAEAGFGAVLAVLFVGVSLPFGLHDAFNVDPKTESTFHCVNGTIKCPFPDLTPTQMVWNFLRGGAGHAVTLALIFAVLAPLAFALARNRPRVLVGLAAGAYLLWAVIPPEAMWKQTYPLPEGPLQQDVARIAQRAGVPMRRVLVGEARTPLRDGGGGKVDWREGEAKAVISERLLNIHMMHPRAFNPPQGPYSAAEFRWVAAHEIAHLRHWHRQIGDGVVVIMTALFAALAFAVARKLTVRGDDPPGAGLVPLLFATGFALHFVVLPIQANLWRIFENQADAAALDLTRHPDGAITFTLQSARRKPLVMDRWYHVLYHTHPDHMTRLRRAVEWKAGNAPDKWRAQGLAGPVRTRSGSKLRLVTDWPEKP